MAWDLWIDFQRADDEGLTRGNVRNLRGGLEVEVGDVIVVGNEDAEPGLAEVVELGDRGFLLVRVFPGTVDENRFRLRPGFARRAERRDARGRRGRIPALKMRRTRLPNQRAGNRVHFLRC